MKTLLTGASGFLGKTILDNADQLSFVTLARHNADICADLSAGPPPLPNCDFVIHCAGKAHTVPKTTEEEKRFYDVNVSGTNNLLRALEKARIPKSMVYISSVSVYGLTTAENVAENHPLLAKDAYGLSKIEAESIVSSWCKKNDVKCVILRLPLLIGSDPPGNLKAMIRAIKGGYYFNIGKGKGKKSMVLAVDVAKLLNRLPNADGIFNLTDRYHPSFYEISDRIAQLVGRKSVPSIPTGMARLIARAGDIIGKKFPLDSDRLRKMTSTLTFDDTAAVEKIGWVPLPVLENFEL